MNLGAIHIAILEGSAIRIFNAHILQLFSNIIQCFWSKTRTEKSCYPRNNMVLWNLHAVLVYQDSCLILYREFSFPILRNTHNIEDFAIQIAICIGSKIQYCNNILQFTVIGIYFATPLSTVQGGDKKSRNFVTPISADQFRCIEKNVNCY